MLDLTMIGSINLRKGPLNTRPGGTEGGRPLE
jgi:hypothetical protein